MWGSQELMLSKAVRKHGGTATGNTATVTGNTAADSLLPMWWAALGSVMKTHVHAVYISLVGLL